MWGMGRDDQPLLAQPALGVEGMRAHFLLLGEPTLLLFVYTAIKIQPSLSTKSG
jgi:hypothetical protein